MSLQEDAKKILPFVQAMAEGMTVEYNQSIAGNANWFEKRDLQFYSETKYRIKPEKKWRPYTREEFIEKCMGKPLRRIGCSDIVMITILSDFNFYTNESGNMGNAKHRIGICDLMKLYTHLDGSPCGVEVEDA